MNPVLPFQPLTVEDVAAVLGVSVRTVENHVDERGLPRPVKIGKMRYWHPDVFYGWLDRVLRGGATEASSAEPACAQATEAVDSNGERAALASRPGPKRAREAPSLSAVERARIRDEAELHRLNGG